MIHTIKRFTPASSTYKKVLAHSRKYYYTSTRALTLFLSLKALPLARRKRAMSAWPVTTALKSGV